MIFLIQFIDHFYNIFRLSKSGPWLIVCTVNVYIPASLSRRPILRNQVLQVRKNCTHFTYSLRTDSYVSCRDIVNNLKLILSDIFCRQYILPDTLNIESKKYNLTYSLRLFYFYLLYLGAFWIYFVSCQTNRRVQTSLEVPKIPVAPGTWELAVGPS